VIAIVLPTAAPRVAAQRGYIKAINARLPSISKWKETESLRLGRRPVRAPDDEGEVD